MIFSNCSNLKIFFGKDEWCLSFCPRWLYQPLRRQWRWLSMLAEVQDRKTFGLLTWLRRRQRSFWHCTGTRTILKSSWMLVFQLNSTTCWLSFVWCFQGFFAGVHVRWLADWRLGEGLWEIEVPSLNRWSFTFSFFKPRRDIIFCVSCKLRKGISLDDTRQEYLRVATAEVVGFMKLQVDPDLNGRQMLQELRKVYPEGIPEVFNGIRIRPKKVAEQIRNEDVHAQLLLRRLLRLLWSAVAGLGSLAWVRSVECGKWEEAFNSPKRKSKERLKKEKNIWRAQNVSQEQTILACQWMNGRKERILLKRKEQDHLACQPKEVVSWVSLGPLCGVYFWGLPPLNPESLGLDVHAVYFHPLKKRAGFLPPNCTRRPQKRN